MTRRVALVGDVHGGDGDLSQAIHCACCQVLSEQIVQSSAVNSTCRRSLEMWINIGGISLQHPPGQRSHKEYPGQVSFVATMYFV